MLIAARNGFMAGGKRVPYDAEVEYLESTGTQWIDTGVPLYSDMQITASLGGLTFFSDSVLFGSNVSTSASAGQFSASMFLYGLPASQIFCSNYNYTTSSISGFVFGDGDHEIKKVGNKTYLDGVLKQSPAAVPRYYAGGNCFIFWGDGYHVGAFANKAKAKIKAFLVCDSLGQPLFDGIPVRFTNEQSQTEGAMYDRVSGQLFRNRGTGAFIIGPDV